MATVAYRVFYKPERVIDFLGLGSNSFIGIVDEATVLKYLKTLSNKEALAALDLKAQILTKIGPYKYIISYKG